MKERITKVCKHCGTAFDAVPWEIKRGGGVFCSRSCFQNHYRTEKIPCTCALCGKQFSESPSELSRGRGCYCSPACQYRALHERGTILQVCSICGREYKVSRTRLRRGEGKYCSTTCFHLAARVVPDRICAECGKQFRGRTSNFGQRFYLCSIACRTKFFVGHHAPNWKGGLSFEPYPINFNKQFKRFVRERDGYICALCGTPNSKVVHHIDYIKTNTTPENCIILCGICHGRTNGNRVFWQAHFEYLMILRGYVPVKKGRKR